MLRSKSPESFQCDETIYILKTEVEASPLFGLPAQVIGRTEHLLRVRVKIPNPHNVDLDLTKTDVDGMFETIVSPEILVPETHTNFTTSPEYPSSLHLRNACRGYPTSPERPRLVDRTNIFGHSTRSLTGNFLVRGESTDDVGWDCMVRVEKGVVQSVL